MDTLVKKQMTKRNETFFDGLAFRGWDNIPAYNASIDTVPQNYYTLQFNQSGCVEYSFNGRPFQTVRGSFAWVTHPHNRYRFRSPSNTRRFHRYISFAGPRCDSYVRQGLIPTGNPAPMIRITKSAEFIVAFNALQRAVGVNLGPVATHRFESGEIFEKHERADAHCAVHALEGLLLQLHEQPQEKPPGIWTEAMREVIDTVQRHPEKSWDFKAEAERLRISVTHFRRLFLEYAALPPERFLRKSQLERAAQLLRETNDTVSGIADAVGFRDVYHFSKSFKSRYTLSPTTYRNQLVVYQSDIVTTVRS